MIKNIQNVPLPVQGFTASGIHCGIKADASKLDLALIYCEKAVAAAGVYTQNVAKAAPVTLTEHHMLNGNPKAILINSGNANACTGEQGVKDALNSAKAVADALGIESNDVLIASTGIIGVNMPMEKVLPGISVATVNLSEEGIAMAGKAIMTTDTYAKGFSVDVEIGGKIGRITGIAKGSGMIHPNMATMLGFVMTDMHVPDAYFKSALKAATGISFNMISVDGDTSTNDMVLALASGAEGAPVIVSEADKAAFYEALEVLSIELAKSIAKDGEGATKLLEMNITGAATKEDAALAAKAVISSSLVKAAFFGKDANWGRILCAMGYSGAKFNPSHVKLTMTSENGSILLMEEGAPVPFDEETALDVLTPDSIIIEAELQDGDACATAWGCDLTYEYVKINGEYRS